MAGVSDPTRRPATPAEAKALAHPVRQRIIRLCGIRERTNKELAEQLDRDPATVLHHVRQLVATGFLEACPERTGPSGAREKPYRSTGASWTLSLDEHPEEHAEAAMLDATREELVASGPDAVRLAARLVIRLPEDELRVLLGRVQELLDEAVERSAPLDDDRLPAHGAVVLVHRFPDPTTGGVQPSPSDEARSQAPPPAAPEEPTSRER